MKSKVAIRREMDHSIREERIFAGMVSLYHGLCWRLPTLSALLQDSLFFLHAYVPNLVAGQSGRQSTRMGVRTFRRCLVLVSDCAKMDH